MVVSKPTSSHADHADPGHGEEQDGGDGGTVRAYPLGGGDGEADVLSELARALAPLRDQLGRGVVLVAVPGPDTDDAALRALRERAAELVGAWVQQAKLVEAMAPPVALPSEAAVLQARRNAEARAALLEEFGGLTSAQVADRGGSRAANRSATANRWRTEGRIFAVPYRGAILFPGFQFDAEGRPRPVVGEVVRRLGGAVSPWELALWFTTASDRLGGARPVDRLGADPDAVVAAAGALFEPAY